MIIKRVTTKCPNCELNITRMEGGRRYSAIGYGILNSLRVLGIPSKFIQCPKECKRCHYIFYHKEIKLNKEQLRIFIASKEYKELVKCESRRFLIIYEIYKKLSVPIKMQNEILLCNYCEFKSMEDLKLLINAYTLYLKENETIDEEFIFAKMMIGEYYRRNEEFHKAKSIFEELVNLSISNDLDVVDKCKFQLELIKRKSIEKVIFPKSS